MDRPRPATAVGPFLELVRQPRSGIHKPSGPTGRQIRDDRESRCHLFTTEARPGAQWAKVAGPVGDKQATLDTHTPEQVHQCSGSPRYAPHEQQRPRSPLPCSHDGGTSASQTRRDRHCDSHRSNFPSFVTTFFAPPTPGSTKGCLTCLSEAAIRCETPTCDCDQGVGCAAAAMKQRCRMENKVQQGVFLLSETTRSGSGTANSAFFVPLA